MITQFVNNYIKKKIDENENYIRYTFYELRIKNKLSEKEIVEFLRINKNYFESNKYQVYFTGDTYKYSNQEKIVEPNELMIAVKG